MPRALGGAPTLSGQWRSLGRSLRANAVRVRRGSPLYNNKKIYGRGVRPRFSQCNTLKTKIFLGKRLGRSALIKLKTTRMALCPASCGLCFKELLGRGAAPTPRPA